MAALDMVSSSTELSKRLDNSHQWHFSQHPDRIDVIRGHLKNRIFDSNQGATENQPAGILKYVEDLRRGSNAELVRKDIFKIISIGTTRRR